MNWLRRLIVLAVFANAGVWLWRHHETVASQPALPTTESGIPGLILQKEYRQLQQGKQRLQGSCWRVGPYADEATVGRAWQSLEYIALDVQKRRITPGGKTLYELSVPASSNREAAALVAESLATTGIRAPEIRSDNTLFLGRYPDLAEAEGIQRQAEQLGIEVLLASRRETLDTQWWLEVTVRNMLGFEQWQTEQNPRVQALPCVEAVSPEPASGVQ